MTTTIPVTERIAILDAWYDAQDDSTKDRINRIADCFDKGVQKHRPGKRIYFGEKSRRELCYALARFIDRHRSY